MIIDMTSVLLFLISDDDFGDNRFLNLPVGNFGTEENDLDAHD